MKSGVFGCEAYTKRAARLPVLSSTAAIFELPLYRY
jgi:hypothetical protein